jgi:hypothetical protein
VDINIEIAKDHSWLNPGSDAAMIEIVKDYGVWDYKRRGDEYEEFGNFNFGAIAAAMGMPYYGRTKTARESISKKIRIRGAGFRKCLCCTHRDSGANSGHILSQGYRQ